MENSRLTFDKDETSLIADLARRLQARIPTLADRLVHEASVRALAERGGGVSEMFRAAMREAMNEALSGFLGCLAEGDVGGAVRFFERIIEQAVRKSFERTDQDQLPEELFARLKTARVMILQELGAIALEAGERDSQAQICFGRLWAQLSESLGILYSRLQREHLCRREQELVAARDAALESARLKSAFLTDVTHELRAPLSVILGYADLMSERLAELEDDTALQYGAPVKRAGERLLETVAGILDLSKAEARGFAIRPVALDLAAAVKKQVNDLKVLAMRKGIALSSVIESPQAEVLFDEHCLTGTITNLLQNAIKFTDEGAVTARLYRDEAQRLCLSIHDTGVGIDPEYLPRLFEPFSQENLGPRRRIEGAGLGLALVKRYMDIHGGEVNVQSEKHRGSVFTLRFASRPTKSATA